jgi:F-type H+-transporting ATPase subunit b
MGWKWANFAILAAGLGYFIGRNAPAFFRGRSEEIRKGIEEATRMKREAEARAAEIERQVAGLGAEVERLRTDARNEMAAEGQRITGETARRLAKIQQQAEQEIVSLGKAARQELQAYAASLAIDLASQHVRSRMNPEIEHRLVDAFVADLHHGAVDRGVGASRGVSPQ